VTQLARNATQSFDDRFSSDNAVINSGINDSDSAANRTVTYTVGTGSSQENVNIELTSTTTLQDFVSQFNSQSTHAQASVVNVGTSSAPSYALMIASNDSGTATGQIAVNVGSAITGAGSFGSSTISQALDAQFTVSGINGTISRSSNSVNDVVSGVTFNLQGTGSSTVTVTNDAAATTSTVQDFVDAYNDLVKYVSDNNQITRQDDGTNVSNTFGPLANTSIDDNALSALRDAFASATSGSGGAVNVLSDLGISTQEDGTLAFDSSKLSTALSSDSSDTGTILGNLGESLSSVDGTIAQFVQFGGIIGQAQQSNQSQISDLQGQVSDAEKQIQADQDSLTARYASLEALIGQLNSQQTALTSLLPK
jgi:flagellar hook-associated protein 2